MSEKKQKTAIIVGAGVGGVALAARLAHAGVKVTVVEKNDYTGGRCSLLHSSDGQYRFDQGPSLMLLLNHFRRTFRDLGTTLEAQMELLKCDPNYVVHFADGDHVRLSTDLTQMREVVEKYEGPDGMERYLGFLQEAGKHSRIAEEHVLGKRFGTLWALGRWGMLKEIVGMHVLQSVWTRAKVWFRSERMRRVMTFGTMYLGMSPFEALGTYSLLQWAELAEGIWYPRGGFWKVIDALVTIAESHGAVFRLSTPITKVLLSPDNTRAIGVVTASGEQLHADTVILNCDLVYAYQHLLPASPATTTLPTRRHSCSSISFYWAVPHPLPQLHAHNIFLADDYHPSFDRIFREHQLPADPSFYVNLPSRIDASAAPPASSAVVVLVPTGHLTTASTPAAIDALVARAREHVLTTLRERIGVDLAPLIAEERVNTPYTWRETFNLTHGAILGLSHDLFNVLSFRPRVRHPEYRGLWFVGASTHPGTGVPVCLAGAKVLAEEVLEEWGVRPTWETAVRGGVDATVWVLLGLLGLLVGVLAWGR